VRGGGGGGGGGWWGRWTRHPLLDFHGPEDGGGGGPVHVSADCLAQVPRHGRASVAGSKVISDYFSFSSDPFRQNVKIPAVGGPRSRRSDDGRRVGFVVTSEGDWDQKEGRKLGRVGLWVVAYEGDLQPV